MKNDDQKNVEDYLLKNENEAFSNLLNRHLRPLYSFIFRMTRNKEDSQDIVQDTFFKVWKNLKKYRAEENFKTWIFTIARNTAIDYLRRKKSVTFSDIFNDKNEDTLEESLVDPEPLPDELVFITEKKKNLDKLLDQLPPMHKEVLLLKYEDDLTFDQISKILKKPLDTVKSQHRRAILKLRELITNAPK